MTPEQKKHALELAGQLDDHVGKQQAASVPPQPGMSEGMNE